MKNFILYVPETEAEFQGLSGLHSGGAENLVFWQNKFYDVVANQLHESRNFNFVPPTKEESSETPAAQVDTEKLQAAVETILKQQKDVFEKLDSHNKTITKLSNFFNPTLLIESVPTTEQSSSAAITTL